MPLDRVAIIRRTLDEIKRHVITATPLPDGRTIAFASRDDLRQYALEEAYRSLEQETVFGARILGNDEVIDPAAWRVTLHYLRSAGLLEPHETWGLTITAQGIRQLERSAEGASSSGIAFVVMAFRPETRVLYDEAIAPACLDTGLQPIRVDKYRQEETLVTAIRHLIAVAEVVVADLTYARPNCYYEVGFAQALGRPLVLSARQDHDPRRPDTDPNLRVHFDLDSYPIEFWAEDELGSFRSRLSDRLASGGVRT